MEPKKTWMEKLLEIIKTCSAVTNSLIYVLAILYFLLAIWDIHLGHNLKSAMHMAFGWMLLIYVDVESTKKRVDDLHEYVKDYLEGGYTLVPTCYVEAVIERAKSDASTQEQKDNVKSVERMVGKGTTENEIV